MAFGEWATLQDDFARADENPIAAPWQNPLIAAHNPMQIASGALKGTVTNFANNSAFDASVYTDRNCEGYFTIVVPPAANDLVTFLLRVNQPNTSLKTSAHGVQLSPTDVRVAACNADSIGTDASSSVSLTLSSGDKIGVSCFGTSISTYYLPSGSITWRQLSGAVLAGTDVSNVKPGFAGVHIRGDNASVDDVFVGTINTLPPGTGIQTRSRIGGVGAM